MSGDLVSIQILAAFGAPPDRALLRQAAGLAAVPIDVREADVGNVRSQLASSEVDIAFVDATTPSAQLTEIIAAAKGARRPPFVILVASAAWEAGEFKAGGVAADGIVSKPTRIEQAKVLIERCVKLKLPSRVLIVDDSSTMRGIVRKLLGGTRFTLDIAEAAEGIDALKQIGSGKFDFVFLDYNMPGLNGVETLSEIKRQHPRVKVVIMTSTQDEALAERAKMAGAVAFLKKPFYPADVEAVLYSLYGLRV
jgi:CheY-like chemotaxis protein